VGKTLTKNITDSISGQTLGQLEFRDRVETEIEQRIEALLGRVVGEGKVSAKVNAEIDFSQIAETATTYDAEGSAVRSKESDVKTMEGTRPGPVGVAGAQSNAPGAPPAANAQVKNDTKTNREITNYHVPQTVRQVKKPAWAVQRLSVAVLVDGKTVKTTAEGGEVQSKVEAWPAEKLQEFQKIVASAVGIDPKRGDILEIKNIDFAREDFEEAEKALAAAEQRRYMTSMITYFVIGLVIVLFFFLVVRPFVKWLTDNTIETVDSFLPQTIEELEKIQKNINLPGMEEAVPVLPETVDPDKVEGEMIKEKIITLVDASPHKAALILGDWLHGDAKKKEAGKEGAAPGKAG
jgi:flagellar M-ring protein FliF